jgi:UDP-glucuronate 4-epimerase
MSARTILVTGGAGFIGSHLCEQLLALGNRVVCYDNFDPYYSPQHKTRNLAPIRRHSRFSLIRGDILDVDLLRTTMQTFGVDRVAHLAARAGVRSSLDEPALYCRVNVEGSINVLEAGRETGVEAVVMASSSSVYGARSHSRFHEDDPAEEPISPYAASKRSMELAAHTYHHLYGLPVSCLRLFTVYGPRQRPEMAIARFAHLIRRGDSIDMYGDGSSKRDYTFVQDIVSGFVSALDRTPDLGVQIINLGNAEVTSLRDLIRTLGEMLGIAPVIRTLPTQPGDVPITHASIERAHKLLGYEPTTSLREGLRRYVRWLGEEPSADESSPTEASRLAV